MTVYALLKYVARLSSLFEHAFKITSDANGPRVNLLPINEVGVVNA